MNSLMDDRDDDVRLPMRGSERRPPQDEAVSHAEAEQDREFTLSTGTVLGIFFALALLCAVFFGFGYSMGRKSGQSSAEASLPSSTASSDVATAKPSPGAPATQPIPGYMSQSEADATNRGGRTQTSRAPVGSGSPTTVVIPTGPAPTATKPVRAAEASTAATVPAAPVERKPAEPRSATVVPATPPVVASSATSSYVQIAAVSHQEDADVLLSALKRRGYAVFTRPGDTDKLIHVQVGPFATKKDADTMRQRLLGDGYNAIVK